MPHIQRDFDVLIHVYSNLRGLTKAYCDAKILQTREDLDRFIRGFNMGLASANIIDAGNGKECSDAKVHRKSTHSMKCSSRLTIIKNYSAFISAMSIVST